MNSKIKYVLAMLLLTIAIFCADLYFSGGAVSVFYICVVLLSHWIDDDWVTLGTTILVMILAFINYYLIPEVASPMLLINKILATVAIGVVSLLITKRKDTETKLKRSNETLELRVLARTAAAEAKSRRLEQQIKILQEIRETKTDDSFSKLEHVINTLTELSEKENS